MNIPRVLIPFLTAYDPSDLPGGSIDPLGFERGYLLLADKIFPGLTNAAGRPRYFSVVCAGGLLAPAGSGNERNNVRMRAQSVLLLERFWAAANVLASEHDSELSASGIRGVTYARAHVEQLKDRGVRSTNADFKMLAQQERYGAIGIYANVAGYLRLLNRAAMSPTQDLGERLGEAFLQETDIPARLRGAIRDGEGAISVESLREWGHRAHIAAPVGLIEGECLGEAFARDPVRQRMADLLVKVPPKTNEETELSRLGRIRKVVSQQSGNQDLQEAIDAILAFEQCYQIVLLGFERVLWLCRADGTMAAETVARDPILKSCAETVANAEQQFQRALAYGTTEHFRHELDRLRDVKEFLSSAAAAKQTKLFVEALLDRHAEVQYGKFDRGRRKLPWIDRKASRYELTLSQVGDVSGEPKSLDAIRPHEYRLATADRFISASLGKGA
ncbi:hypothetical protein [Bradyrhizobium elkanii]|uniref:hypothetical protein n=1 Tax=Bradyrhizobium elkanii TaxID=29448 RepID=UPI0012FDAA48|nr:hypothetical protein [Bradyrhizobium elkanii]